MKRIALLFSMVILIGCKTQLKIGKYKNTCYSTDAPSNILILGNNKYTMVYPASVEKIQGIWVVKKDTLFLKSLYKGSLEEKDSLSYNEEIFFLIKRNKLFSPINKKCFLRNSYHND